MDGIDQLRRQALLRRNAAILQAKREYHAALKEIKQLARKLTVKQPGRPRKSDASDLSGLRAGAVARAILREGTAMTTVELTLEVQRRGCRSLDDPRIVAKAVREGLKRHREFRKDEKGRWGYVGCLNSGPAVGLEG
jgi:hypothetical protein